MDFSEVLQFARRAAAAYQEEPAIRAVVGPDPALTVSNLRGVDVRAFVEVDEGKRRQWVVVRGTANLMNAAEDADYLKVHSADLGIVVHRGFLDDERAVWTFVQPLLGQASRRGSPDTASVAHSPSSSRCAEHAGSAPSPRW